MARLIWIMISRIPTSNNSNRIRGLFIIPPHLGHTLTNVPIGTCTHVRLQNIGLSLVRKSMFYFDRYNLLGTSQRQPE